MIRSFHMVCVTLYLASPSFAQTVISPDTVKIGEEVLRLRGIDTPSLAQHRCWNELQRAERAIALLRKILIGREVQIERFGSSRGATHAVLRLSDGTDVGSMLISQGLAYPWNPKFGWHAKRAYWCRKES